MISDEERAELVKYRLQRSGETLDEAELLLNARKLPGAVNRIYYAVFYAAGALLLKHGLSSAKDAGLISLFHKEIVNKGVLENEFGKIL
ncbi:MAG: HEPN domain-containing protein [Chitinivibrionales bacterium]|nr:HEPN domain-containing protein [Chitinivibrionales bacterium]